MNRKCNQKILGLFLLRTERGKVMCLQLEQAVTKMCTLSQKTYNTGPNVDGVTSLSRLTHETYCLLLLQVYDLAALRSYARGTVLELFDHTTYNHI